MRRFKGSKKEFRGLMVALINNLVVITFWYLRGNSIDILQPIYIALGKKGHKRRNKGAKKEFM